MAPVGGTVMEKGTSQSRILDLIFRSQSCRHREMILCKCEYERVSQLCGPIK